MSRQCPKCGTDHPTETRQCGQCGLPLQGSIKDRLKWLRDDEGRANHIREEADRVKNRELARQQEEMVKSLEKTGVPAKVRAIAHQVCDEYLRTHDTDAYVHEAHSSDGIYLDLIWNQRRGTDKDWGFDEQTRGGSHLRFHIAPDHTIDISAGRGKRSVRR
jgi:hypothetical protein